MAGVKGALASVVAWVLGAVTAVGVGLVALTMIGGGFGHDPVQPLSADNTAGPGSGTASATTTPTTTPATSSSSSLHTAVPPSTSMGPQQLLSSRGGTVVARCRLSDSDAYLVFWSPAQGYRVGGVVRGPAPEARVTFHGHGLEVKVVVTCAGATPHADIHQEADGPGDD